MQSTWRRGLLGLGIGLWCLKGAEAEITVNILLLEHFKNHGCHMASPNKIFHHSQREPPAGPAAPETTSAAREDRAATAKKGKSAPAAGDLILADFEGKTWTPWTASGAAFDSGPFRPAASKRPEAREGSCAASSGEAGPKAEGELLSPAFTIQRKCINFLICGQRDFARRLGVELLLDGRVVRSSSATEVRSPPVLYWRTWDVAKLAGRTVRLRINDHPPGATSLWIRFSRAARRGPCLATPARCSSKATGRWRRAKMPWRKSGTTWCSSSCTWSRAGPRR